MRLRNIPGSREAIAESEFVIHDEESCKGKWKEIFGNDNPIYIEIGMGKGTFIMECARRNPNINYIGIEKYSSVLLRALEKREKEPDLKNLYFIRMEAEYIENVFEKDEVDSIYLNFSDPWPKDRNAKRRLTSDRFLKRYTGVLKKDGVITFKTDNIDLFDFSVETAKECGWDTLAETRDLHHSEYNEGNIMTEYEKKFSGLGHKINMMKIRQPS
ncbi:MAG: tRNA (guanosine(46)-N7)-methyltransferase TrmB [Eubacterium sp.]|nr:tRNA (guanosine(46)-N7)-methyltransferase TrmB [Eubacterium sp.]